MTIRLGPRCAYDRWSPAPASHSRFAPDRVSITPRLARLLHSLVRVSRRVARQRLDASVGAGPTDRQTPAVVNPPLRRNDARTSPRSTLGPRPQPQRRAVSSQRGTETTPGHLPHRPCGPEAILADESVRKVRRRHRHSPTADAPLTAVGETRRSGRRGTRGEDTPAESHADTARRRALPSQRFRGLFDSLFKVLFTFPSRYLFAIGLVPLFSFGWSLPPTLGCIPKQPDSPTAK